MDRVHGLNESPMVVVMVPLPAQGHLNQMLHFSRLVSTRGILVHYIGSPMHNRQARNRVQGWDPHSVSNIHFHDFPLPPFVNPPPDPNAPSKFPQHLVPALNASLHLCEPLSELLLSLSSNARRVIVIHDPLMAFAAREASWIPNGEAYALHCISTFATLFFMWEGLGQPKNVVFPNGLPLISSEDIPEGFEVFVKQQYQFMNLVAGNLHNTCKPIEGTFIDLLAQEQILGKKRQWAIGPLNPVAIEGSARHHKCLDWLDKQPLDSVLYVSFGTATSIPDEQINEIAIGLECSEQRFIWVLREADRGDIYAKVDEERKPQVPDGYEERVEGRGMIVSDWAPQLEILAHPSTGGFLSHCGWNSCIESMSMGVPIVAWPMHSDQPRNTMLVTEVLKIGLVVREWESRRNIVPSLAIESSVRKLMVSEEGEGMRMRAKELGISVRQATSEGGSSVEELDSFLNYIAR